jgi:4-amino-4-deoxy-L-arabinose transferase-like glycosyltransferase
MKRLFPVLFAALVLLRLPSVVQPAGADQGLYAYVGQAIARGEVPYRDAWDQKPPAIHFTYALMYAVWPDDSVVAATDLLVTTAVAALLLLLGRRLTGGRGAGEIAALVFLLLGNPAFGRVGGVWVRAQCETFIALLAVAALLLIAHGLPGRGERARPRAAWLLGAGVLLGLAFLFKYNAAAYLLAAAGTIALLGPLGGPRRGLRSIAGPIAIMGAGAAVPVAVAAAYFVATGAMGDLYAATITYNLQYSGETYGGVLGFVRYLLTFPIIHGKDDSVWLLGGLGCAILLLASLADRARLVAPVWVAAACLSIAVNGGRGLAQYFVQALPLLSLAAGVAAMLAWRASGVITRIVLVVLLAIAIVRVSQFDKLAENAWFDVQHARGVVSRTEYLARFGGRSTDKYSALAVRDLGDYLKAHTAPSDRVFIFGFSGGAYVRAGRVSASRFFWNRPILSGFNEGVPGYGTSGVLRDLQASRPAYVVLQRHDWPAERAKDSADFFLQHPRLGEWLRARYDLAVQNDTYQIWGRRTGAGRP